MAADFTVICHYYNEEYLLSWWLKHHSKLFNHGVMIDYGSTDKSNDLIRQLAPNWEIRKSRNPNFDIEACEKEVMEIEREFKGWKTVLNTTEFLYVKNKDDFLNDLEKSGDSIYRANGIIMADPIGYYKSDPDPDKPLTQQRFHGYLEKEKHRVPERDRFIHKFPDGAYKIGRHSSKHPKAKNHPEAFVLWFGFSPWNKAMVQRKLFIQKRIPIKNKRRGWGKQHFVDANKLKKMYRARAALSEDLRLREDCNWIFSD
ncbi:glycosyltransferase family 2 protein [Bacillus sp. ISL-47]|uniref:glycosyltransferase family 2 protein n=1 Tax=Bacillus sp. ISL-47 TaxID=2819130 RepID=UPI001BED36E2|nr:glycosyltransferase family 2 protein [Bacillus sp. ISL-47]MBT2686910.1 glycosyltransferase family 2 protein [Bacillus sp. ISL-47]MBT2710449.1 glycosyltransferase family 2 protein [Pseudomonas sp. ISL-84]